MSWNDRDSISFLGLIDMLRAYEFKAKDYNVRSHSFFLLLIDQKKEAQNLILKAIFFQRKFFKKMWSLLSTVVGHLS